VESQMPEKFKQISQEELIPKQAVSYNHYIILYSFSPRPVSVCRQAHQRPFHRQCELRGSICLPLCSFGRVRPCRTRSWAGHRRQSAGLCLCA